MELALTLGSFLFFTALVGLLTWWITHKDDHNTSQGYFLGGRSLTFPLIAGSLLLTNLSTEQMVGLNGAAFNDGLCVMVWEVVCVIALVFMAWFFLPRFLRSGVATVPQFLEIRFDHGTQVITNVIFLAAYVGILLPIILYTGATGMIGILDVSSMLPEMHAEEVVENAPDAGPLLTGAAEESDNAQVDDLSATDGGQVAASAGANVEPETDTDSSSAASASGDEPPAEDDRFDREDLALWLIVWMVGIIGSIYALFGGLRTVAVSDTLNGIGLLVGGFLITGFALAMLGGDGGLVAGGEVLWDQQRERFNSVGSEESSVPFGTIFSGIFLLNLFYWTTNQQIIQRTFGASSLAEGQKGVLLTGALKLLGPLYLVVPGMIAYSVFMGEDMKADQAYGSLVHEVLPWYLNGFFAAAMIGAILSSFNSALNSSCTLFSLGLYKSVIRPAASEHEVVRSGKIFGWIVAISAMCIAPLLANTGSIFGYLQKMNGMYFIPIFATVLVGMLTRRVPPLAAKVALIGGFLLIAIGYFVPPFNEVVESMHEFYFLGTVFGWLVVIMLIIGEMRPREEDWIQEDVKAVDMTPWRLAGPAGGALIVIVLLIYITFADFSVLNPQPAETATGAATTEVNESETTNAPPSKPGGITPCVIAPFY